MLALAVAVLIVLAGCGGGDAGTTATPPDPDSTTTTAGTGDGTPTTTGPPVVKSGAELFSVFCAGCHGADGKAKFSPTLVGVDAAKVKTMITEGSEQMQGYKDKLSPADVQAIVDYVVTLK
ncbi:MAG: c-type cytochrome [Thermoleophilia bacterium]